MPDTNELPVAELHKLFRLDEESGNLFWLVANHSKKRLNRPAGYASANGRYRGVGIDNKQYPAHRIVFAMVHGRWPKDEIDHINCNRLDNRPCNLREATRIQNARNIGLTSMNKTGYKGVSYNKSGRKFSARISIHKKVIGLGTYDDAESAHHAYCKAAKELHGEFANTGAKP